MKDYFSFSKSEQRGILVLIIILLLQLFFISFRNLFYSSTKPYDIAGIQNAIEALNRSADSLPEKFYYGEIAFSSPNLFYFNPNTASDKELATLGFTQKNIKTIRNYLKSGGHFYSPQDINKIYGIDKALSAALIPYIEINQEKVDLIRKEKRQENLDKYELNMADTNMLLSIPGIGPVLASRVLKYRNILGGFYSLDQLKEVYGLDSNLISTISSHLFIDTSQIKRLSVNKSDFKTLEKHPYISKYQAEGIIQYRKTQGEFKQIEDLVKYKIISKDEMRKVAHYIIP